MTQLPGTSLPTGLPDAGVEGHVVEEPRVDEAHRQVRHTGQLHGTVWTIDHSINQSINDFPRMGPI